MLVDTRLFAEKMYFEMPVGPGDVILWLRWKNVFSSPHLDVIDLWEMREGDSVAVTSRIDRLPEWFQVYPTEVSGIAALSAMQRKLDGGYRPNAPMDGPNIWRAHTGDRVVRVSASSSAESDPNATVIAFKADAFIYGERQVHVGDIPWFLAFGALLEPSEAMAAQIQVGLDCVKKVGLPREIALSGWALS